MKRIVFMLCVIVCSVMSASAADKVEPAGPVPATAKALEALVASDGVRVVLADGKIAAEIWPAKSVTGEGNASESALYPDIPRGAFAGVIRFPSGAQDIRGQKVAAGTYSLRYALLPGDGNHMGVTPNPDFFLLVPVDADTDPATPMPYMRLVKASTKAAGTAHPASFSLAPAGKSSPSVESNEQQYTVATFDLTVGGKKTRVGLIVVGVAEQ